MIHRDLGLIIVAGVIPAEYRCSLEQSRAWEGQPAGLRWAPRPLPHLPSTTRATCPAGLRGLRPLVLRGDVERAGIILFLPDGLNDSPVPEWTACPSVYRPPALPAPLSHS